jgi:hypothetical protein
MIKMIKSDLSKGLDSNILSTITGIGIILAIFVIPSAVGGGGA